VPTIFDIHADAASDEVVYPLSPGNAAPPSRKKKKTPPVTPAEPAKPKHLDYTLSNTGRGSGTFGGDKSGHLDRNVIVTVSDPDSGETATLYADEADYDGMTGAVTATGTLAAPVRMVSSQGTFSGPKLVYNFLTKTGTLTHATIISDTYKVYGDVIEAHADGSFVAYNAIFTGCDHGTLDGRHGLPDYRIFAKRLTIVPGDYVSAKRSTFYIGRTPTVPIPSYQRDLSEPAPVSSLPLPSYNRTNGLTMHLVGTPMSEKHSTFDYDTLLSFKELPIGFFLYQNDITRTSPTALPPRGTLASLGNPLNSLLEQFNPPNYAAYTVGRPYEVYPDRVTFYGVLGNAQNIYNRSVTGVTLSRLPEAGIHIGNILGRLPADPDAVPTLRTDQIPYAPALLEAYTSLGVLHESPSGVTAVRLFTRINYASQPMVIGRRLSWRYGATNWLNGYSRGTIYELFAPEAEMDYVPTRTSAINLGYRYLTDAGSTPFVFDRRDIRHEMRVQYQVGGPYLFSVNAKFDMEELRAYDEEVTIVRRLDCLQYGVSYSVRYRSFNVIFNLLPARKPADNKSNLQVQH